MLGLGLGVDRGGFVPSLPLLDVYGGAAAAYSLRKLRNNYTGAAIRVRESATNTEADIGFNADGTLNTTALLAHTGANNGFVTTWYDQSGNANNATQSTAANQPQIVSGGGVILENGEAAVSFDGMNDILQNTVVTSVQPNTYFAVFKGNTIIGAKQRILDGITSRNAIFNTSGVYTLFAGATANSSYSNNTNQNSLYALFNGASSELNINGGTPSSINPSTNSLNGLSIGRSIAANSTHDGVIQEVIFYPSDQSSNRTAIESNINAYYNIY